MFLKGYQDSFLSFHFSKFMENLFSTNCQCSYHMINSEMEALLIYNGKKDG